MTQDFRRFAGLDRTVLAAFDTSVTHDVSPVIEVDGRWLLIHEQSTTAKRFRTHQAAIKAGEKAAAQYRKQYHADRHPAIGTLLPAQIALPWLDQLVDVGLDDGQDVGDELIALAGMAN